VTTSLDEALQDAWESNHPYVEEVRCPDCGKEVDVRFMDGEPIEGSLMRCPCGGEREIA